MCVWCGMVGRLVVVRVCVCERDSRTTTAITTKLVRRKRVSTKHGHVKLLNMQSLCINGHLLLQISDLSSSAQKALNDSSLSVFVSWLLRSPPSPLSFKLELDSIFSISFGTERAPFLASWRKKWEIFQHKLALLLSCVLLSYCTSKKGGGKKDTTFSSHFQHHFSHLPTLTLTPFFVSCLLSV